MQKIEHKLSITITTATPTPTPSRLIRTIIAGISVSACLLLEGPVCVGMISSVDFDWW